MQRDMELMRKIVREVQAKTDLRSVVIEVEGYEAWFVQRHLELMLEAGLLDGQISKPLGMDHSLVLVKDLTMAGHDFATAVANETVWSKLRKSLTSQELATMPIKILVTVSQALLESYAKSKLGLNGHGGA